MSYFMPVTPTWQGLLPCLLAVLENGSAEGRAMARVELSRMAQAADLHNDAVRPEPLTITHLHDAGHGWLSVDYSLIDRLKIGHRISAYSYRAADVAWLEEDCDASILLTALESAGITYRIVNQHVEGDAFIRGLPRWSNN
jgi:hypothetical protein